MAEPDMLADFLGWFLRHGMAFLEPKSVYGYGPIHSMVLLRRKEFQVELFTVSPGAGFQEEHRHPNVDSYEVHVCGEIALTINGRESTPEELKDGGGNTRLVTRVNPADWHGARPVPDGGAFLSVQRWLNGAPPTSVGLDWEGPPTAPEHAALLTGQLASAHEGAESNGR